MIIAYMTLNQCVNLCLHRYCVATLIMPYKGHTALVLFTYKAPRHIAGQYSSSLCILWIVLNVLQFGIFG